MPKALIIGGSGFVGSYLIEELIDQEFEVFATKLPHEQIQDNRVEQFDLDILDTENFHALLDCIRPDCIFHLAAQSSVALSWTKPDLTVDINIKGTIHLLDGLRKLDNNPKVLLIGSSEEYGPVLPEELPIREENTLRPANVYAATKTCQGMLGQLYAQAYGLNIISVRAFNHIGPKQSEAFVVSNFCQQVARIEKGLQPPVLDVGNLSAKRDFTDVRDIVKGYVQLINQGLSGQVYNIGQGKAYTIDYILSRILSFSPTKVEIQVNPEKLRPVDVPLIVADIQKINLNTGWKPEIELDTSLLDTLNYWRNTITL